MNTEIKKTAAQKRKERRPMQRKFPKNKAKMHNNKALESKELKPIEIKAENENGELTIIKDITNIPTLRKYTQNLSESQRRYLNVLLWPPAKDLDMARIAKLAGISVATGYHYRNNPDFIRAYRELALVFHQGKAPKIYNHMLNNALNSKYNKDSLEYLKATGSIDDRVSDVQRQANTAATELLRAAFEGYVEEKASRKAREIVEKERRISDAEYEIMSANNAENSAEMAENENETLTKRSRD